MADSMRLNFYIRSDADAELYALMMRTPVRRRAETVRLLAKSALRSGVIQIAAKAGAGPGEAPGESGTGEDEPAVAAQDEPAPPDRSQRGALGGDLVDLLS